MGIVGRGERDGGVIVGAEFGLARRAWQRRVERGGRREGRFYALCSGSACTGSSGSANSRGMVQGYAMRVAPFKF
eukprot:1764251-Rhodomonas_salina.1